MKNGPHQGLDNKLSAPTTAVIGTGQMKCRERLGGLSSSTTARLRSRMGRVFAQDGRLPADIALSKFSAWTNGFL